MPNSKEKEDLPGLGPVALSESKVPTPATNRARQIGDSLENLLSGVQKQVWPGGCGKQESDNLDLPSMVFMETGFSNLEPFSMIATFNIC